MDVEKFLVKAEAALRKRAAPQAIALYKQVLVASPDHGAARSGLLSAYRRKSELKGGPNMLDRAAAKSLRVTAMGLTKTGQHALVVKNCEAGLEKHPDEPVLLAMLADALVASSRPAEALACWESRLEADPDNVEALKAAGLLQYDLKDFTGAIDMLDRAHKLDAHDPEVEKLRKHLLAEGTLANTKFETATSSRDLIKDREAMRKAETTDRLHRTDEELAGDVTDLAAAVAERPDDLDAVRRLARAQVKTGDAEGAEATLNAALERRPEDDSLLDLRGDLLLARLQKAAKAARAGGDAAEAKRLARELAEAEADEFGRRVRRNPGDAAARLRLARACYRCGRTKDSIEAFQGLVSDPRLELDALRGLAACFAREGQHDLARKKLEAALAKATPPGSDPWKQICYDLGLVFERLGDTSGAQARFLEIYEIDIGFKDVADKITSSEG